MARVIPIAMALKGILTLPQLATRTLPGPFRGQANASYAPERRFLAEARPAAIDRASHKFSPRALRTLTGYATTNISISAMNQVWLCGQDWNYPVLAKSLFGKTAKLLINNRDALENDVMVYGVGSNCRFLNTFPGYVLTMNGESRRSHATDKNKKHFFIGPWVENDRTLMIYNVARRYLSLKDHMPDWFLANGMPTRLKNDREHFAIYASRNCQKARDAAFRRLNSIATVHASGNCPRNVAKTKSPYATPRSQMENNPKLFSHYKFVLCMENKKQPGYVTEKILYAFISGAIPIYYGTEEVFELFNRKAFIYYDVFDPQEALDLVTHLNSNETAYRDIVSQPILAEGLMTLEKYFSLDDDIGSGQLKSQILSMINIKALPQ